MMSAVISNETVMRLAWLIWALSIRNPGTTAKRIRTIVARMRPKKGKLNPYTFQTNRAASVVAMVLSARNCQCAALM